MSLSPMKFGTVKGRFLAAVGDSTDLDLDPDAVPMSGEIEFVPQASAILLATGDPDPATILPSPIVCGLDTEGYLVYPKDGTDRTVRLVATGDAAQNPHNWTYEVKYRLTLNGRSVGYASYNIEVPAGVVTDLTLSARVPSSTGTAITRGIGVVDVQSSDGVMTMLLSDGTATDPITLPIGPVGPPPELSIGVVTTGPPTPGTPGPKGDTGAKGDPGGFVTGTSLGTADLNNIVTAGIYQQDTPANALLERNYPAASLAGSMTVFREGSGRLVQVFYPVTNSTSGAVYYYRTANLGPAWTTWKTFSSQRVNQTAGRAIYTWDDLNNREQLIYGDTGWRDVKALLINGWIGTLYVRRSGQQVNLMGEIDGRAFTSDHFLSYTALSGFNPLTLGNAHVGVGTTVNSQITKDVMYATNVNWYIRAGATHKADLLLKINLSYLTSDNWPTTLPGVPVGPSIPNL